MGFVPYGNWFLLWCARSFSDEHLSVDLSEISMKTLLGIVIALGLMVPQAIFASPRLPAGFLLPTLPENRQEDSGSEEQEKAKSEIGEVLTHLQESLKENDVATASQWMTSAAAEGFIGDMILMSIEMGSAEMAAMGFEEIAEVNKKYGFDQMELPPAFSDPEAKYPSAEEMQAFYKTLLEKVDAKGDRFQIAKEIRDAMSDFIWDPFEGDITELSLDGQKVSVTLTSQDGFTNVLIFEASDQGWLWSGHDLAAVGSSDEEDFDFGEMEREEKSSENSSPSSDVIPSANDLELVSRNSIQPSNANVNDGSEIVIEMTPCQMERNYDEFFVESSKQMTLKGSVEVAGESFDIYFPEDDRGYSTAARPLPEDSESLAEFTSTYLAVDQNHDGNIAWWESYYAEFPLRIGDSMFDVVAIAEDGSALTLRPNDGPLVGAVIGRKAPDFTFQTIDGKTLGLKDYEGQTLIIDCWAPG